MRARLAVALLGAVLAVALGFYADARGAGPLGILLLACGPLVALTLPAGLLAWAAFRHGDPYLLYLDDPDE